LVEKEKPAEVVVRSDEIEELKKIFYEFFVKESSSKTHNVSHYQPKYYERNSSDELFTLEPETNNLASANSARSSLARRSSKLIVLPNIPLTELLEIEQLDKSEEEISQISHDSY
jgi:hypothetical protein